VLPTPASQELMRFLQDQGVQDKSASVELHLEVEVEEGGTGASLQPAEVAAPITSPPTQPSDVSSPADDATAAQLAAKAQEAAKAADRWLKVAADAASSAAMSAWEADEAAAAVAQLYGARSLQATNASNCSTRARWYAKEATAALQRAKQQALAATEAQTEARHSAAVDAAAQSQKAAGQGSQAALNAKRAQELAAKIQEEASSSGPSYRNHQQFNDRESTLLCYLHRLGLLLKATPRDVKRMLNRYLLAKHIMQATHTGEVRSLSRYAELPYPYWVHHVE